MKCYENPVFKRGNLVDFKPYKRQLSEFFTISRDTTDFPPLQERQWIFNHYKRQRGGYSTFTTEETRWIFHYYKRHLIRVNLVDFPPLQDRQLGGLSTITRETTWWIFHHYKRNNLVDFPPLQERQLGGFSIITRDTTW